MADTEVGKPERAVSAVLGMAAGFAAGAYGAWAVLAWWHYGHPPRPSAAEHDPLLDRLMPAYDVGDRHATTVAAPAELTLDIATRLNVFRLPVTAAIVRARELILGAKTEKMPRRPRGLLDELQTLGWVILEQVAGREIIMGAATRPWEANVTFRSIPAAEFAAFAEPGYVKIVWTLRADERDERSCVLRAETRAVATDATAARRFRRYWALLSPGIVLIRLNALHAVRAEAERRARVARG